tara:strand:- start:59 stop:403 length:345 start_codon:yes stop_codon:yes gene_type:complete
VQQSSNLTITKHILLEGRKSINGLEVYRDLGRMNWHEAKIACKKLGTGWRLPTKDELNMLYENKEEIGGFSPNYYWSSTENDYDNAWGQYFNDGVQNYGSKLSNFNLVRSVRAS